VILFSSGDCFPFKHKKGRNDSPQIVMDEKLG
jgi:hypothetical protein